MGQLDQRSGPIRTDGPTRSPKSCGVGDTERHWLPTARQPIQTSIRGESRATTTAAASAVKSKARYKVRPQQWLTVRERESLALETSLQSMEESVKPLCAPLMSFGYIPLKVDHCMSFCSALLLSCSNGRHPSLSGKRHYPNSMSDDHVRRRWVTNDLAWFGTVHCNRRSEGGRHGTVACWPFWQHREREQQQRPNRKPTKWLTEQTKSELKPGFLSQWVG